MSELTAQMQLELADIRERYDRGQLDAGTVAELAEMAIDAEIEKPDGEINNAWLDACAELIDYVNRDHLSQFPEHREDTWQAIHEQIQEREKHRGAAWIKPLVRIAACLVLLFGLSVCVPHSWIRGLRDNQAHRPEGHESILVTEAKAEDTPTPPVSTYETAEFSEVCKFLGVTPDMPAWVPEGWQAHHYTAEKRENAWRFSACYTKAAEEAYLQYDMEWSTVTEALNVPVLQDGAGENVTLDNGLTVSLSTSAGQPLAVWTTDNSVARYSGPVTEEELIQSIASIP